MYACGPPGGEQESQGGRRQCSASSGHLTWLPAPTYPVSLWLCVFFLPQCISRQSRLQPLPKMLLSQLDSPHPMKAVPCAKCGRVWPKCGRGVAAARQARCAPLLSSILPEGPPRASTRRPAACAAKATAVDAFRGPIRPSLIACGRSVAEVWPMCGRSTAGALCAAAELHTVTGAAKDHDAPHSGQCGQKNCCLRIHVLIRASL